MRASALPVNFSISYEYDFERGLLKLDLALPLIDELPKEDAVVLPSGKARLKPKTQKELNEDYLRCVCGLALFFASSLFNISTHISAILVSGYRMGTSASA